MIKLLFRNIILKCASYYYNNRDSKVFFYHDLHVKKAVTEMSTPLEKFKEHLSVIRAEGFAIVADITRSSEQVKIQFDDGFKGIYDCYPYIKENKIPIEIFVISENINTEGFLSLAQIKELGKDELIRISSHTHTHPELGLCSDDQIREELTKSKEILEKRIGQEVRALCYPKGSFSKHVVAIAKDLGYTEQYSSLPGSFSQEIFPNVFRRNLLQYASVSEVKSALRGAHQMFFKKYWNRQFVR